VDGIGFDVVSNPYGNDFTYKPEGFLGSEAEFGRLRDYLSQFRDNDPRVLLSHVPPRCEGVNGVDVVNDGKNVGEPSLNNVTDLILSAHIHEAGGRGCDFKGNVVNENQFSNNLRFNPGAASPWQYLNREQCEAMVGIFTIQGNQAKYEILRK
jgi:Icc-related predicted phosphoesterase